MKKFWIKLFSNILFFYSKEKRKIYRGKHNDATMYNANLRKRGISIGKCTYIADGVSVRDKRTIIGSFCSIARNVSIGTGSHPLTALTPILLSTGGVTQRTVRSALLRNTAWRLNRPGRSLSATMSGSD